MLNLVKDKDECQTRRHAMRINDFCATIGIGRTKAYELINEGKLTAISIAGRTLIPATEVDRLIAEAVAEAKRSDEDALRCKRGVFVK